MKRLALLLVVLSLLVPSLVEAAPKPGWSSNRNTYTAAYHTVFMSGGNFSMGHYYAIGFYDGAGAKAGSDVSGALVETSLSCQFELSTHWSAAPGTWHSVVFDAALGSPPTAYAGSSAAPGYIVEDSFTVLADAIPEFPDIRALLFVALVCGFTYIVLKKN